MAMKSTSLKGPLLMFSSAVLFSLGGLFIKLIPWDAPSTNGARNLVGVCVVGLYMLLSRHKLRLNPAVLLGAAAYASTTTLFTFANKLTTAANAIVLQFSAPVFIILFMWLIFKEKPSRLDTVTCVIVLSGILLFFIDSLSVGGMLGNILSLLSGVTYAFVFMSGTFHGSDPLSSVFWGQVICSAACGPFIFFETDFSFRAIIFIVILGVFQLGLAYILFSKGIVITHAVTAVLVSAIEPILSPVWTMIFYNEKLTLTALAGGVIVVGAIVAYNIIKARTQSDLPPPEEKTA
ncbi:MAG: EamA family transporter [Clostridiales bacterium]|nr:EamA family transporter [Clostridiales bacterium]